jgi:hypothetical protein
MRQMRGAINSSFGETMPQFCQRLYTSPYCVPHKCPLSSDAPRAYRLPSCSAGSKGAVRHFSIGSTGWTS